MSTSADQVARLLALVPYLQAHQGIAVADAAKAFQITPAQVMKDLNVLWMCGLPGGLPGDLIEIDMDAAAEQGTIHLTNADYLSRPMRFTLDEVMSLVVALRAVAEVASGPTAEAVHSALAKLEALTTSGESERVAIRVASGDEVVRGVLTGAIDAGRRARLVYDGLTRGHTSTPEVDPARIDLRDGAAYLQAWSLERDAWRTYKLDRIVEATALEQAAEDHGEPPPPLAGWFEGSTSVVLELQPSAAWITEYYPTRRVESAGTDGELLVAELPVADPCWLRGLLLRLGGALRVLEPVGAGQDAANVAREALALNASVFGSNV
ncbi:helix-turn-helix transcriptional regulator [Luteococcus japonicus]|uniref:Possible DNA-binding protein n=1 Tax=Luteococcus japonicus LSP_Lj1 TaxID=1255658 RepID=A0A1R4JRA7_9ACTN|nr:WYL domain-containing protein [Luteococcus japonicus]SJN34512.1 possible DNA-binding protein [Luteococcus japonicus LSP_Lj1]